LIHIIRIILAVRSIILMIKIKRFYITYTSIYFRRRLCVIFKADTVYRKKKTSPAEGFKCMCMAKIIKKIMFARMYMKLSD
jgi:hypothetical protein